MKASPAHQKQLLELQALDTHLLRLERSEQTLPESETLIQLNKQLDTVVARLANASKHLDDAREELLRVEADVAVVQAREDRDSERLQRTASVKDAQALESELQALAVRRGDLEDKQLVLMERVDSLESDHTAVDTEREQLTRAIADMETQRVEKIRELHEQKDTAHSQRQELSSKLPENLLALYEKQRDRYGIGAALLRGGVSLGSNVRLTTADLDEIRRAAPDDVVLCPDSNAILVRTEESGL